MQTENKTEENNKLSLQKQNKTHSKEITNTQVNKILPPNTQTFTLTHTYTYKITKITSEASRASKTDANPLDFV